MALALSMILLLSLTLSGLLWQLRQRKRVAAGLSVVIALLGIGLYVQWSDDYYRYLQPPWVDDDDRFLEDFEQHLRDQGGSAESWALLANMYATQARYNEAVEAYQRAEMNGNLSPEEMVEFAEVRFLSSEQTFDDKSRSLLATALATDPTNQKALWFNGFAAFADENYVAAIAHWTRLSSLLDDNPGVRARVDAQIKEAEALRDGDPRQARVGEVPVPPAEGPVIEVGVRLAPELRDKVSPNDTLFVYARATSGPRAPLAIKRLLARDIPLNARLTVADAMVESMTLANFDKVEVFARISKSGRAISQPGDFYGKSAVVDPKTGPAVAIVITETIE